MAVLLLVGVAVLPVSAQITTGNVTGTVKDAQGGVVPGATVLLISEARGTKLAPVITNAAGVYRVAVPTLTLEVGGATETVNVTAEAALVQSQSAERSFAISTEQVENLPISHGNFINFTQLTPGVQAGGASAGA